MSSNGRSELIRIEGLTCTYGQKRVLDQVDFSLSEGQICGFLGPNGAGKSTLIQCIMGLVQYDQGVLSIFNQDRVTQQTLKQIGYVSQHPQIYGWMSAQQLAAFVGPLYPSWDQAYFENLLKQFAMDPKKRFDQLSIGNQAKLALMLALSHHPKLLILDEPNAALDPLSRREFSELVKSEAETILMSSHLIDEIEDFATDVTFIVDGKILIQAELTRLRERVKLFPAADLSPLQAIDGVKIYHSNQQHIIAELPENTDAAAINVAGQSLSLEDLLIAMTERYTNNELA